MQQLVVNYWGTYTPVFNCISVRLILAIASIHEFPSISIDLVLVFTQDCLDVDVFMDIPLVMVVDGNRVEWVINLIK